MSVQAAAGSERFRSPLVFLSVAALLLVSLVVAALSEQQYRHTATAAAEVQARVLAETGSAALSFGVKKELDDYVNALRLNEEVEAVGMYDEHGVLAAGFTRNRLAQHLADTLSLRTAPGRIIVTAPVVQGGVHIGTVYLRDRTEPLSRRAERYIGPGLLLLMALIMFAVTTVDARSLRHANRRLVNQIAETHRAEAALRQSQKMEAVGRLTGGIAHDFNNMLAIVLGSLDLVQRRYAAADPKLLSLVGQAIEGARRAANLTQRLLAFSRLQPLKPAPADINRAVGDMTDLLSRTLGETVSVETVLSGGLWRAFVDLPQLETALVNLAINARDAMSDGGKLTIETANTYLDRAYAEGEDEVSPGQYVMMAITDTGCGIAPEIMAQVFEPFFTTKPVGVGTGLGLSQVHGFIKQSGGHIRLYSEVGIGTTVKLYLPRSTAEPEPVRALAARSQAHTRREVTVLLVEDEQGVREFAVEALNELGYDVVAADGPEAALKLLDVHPEVSILLTDVVMPGMNGRVMAEEARRRRPDLQVVFMTGYTRNAIVHNGMLDPGTRLINKPFTVADLDAELEAMVAERRRG